MRAAQKKPEKDNSGGTLHLQFSVTIHQPVHQGGHSTSVPSEGRMGRLDGDGAFIVNNEITTMAPAPLSQRIVSILKILTETMTKDTMKVLSPAAKKINMIGYQKMTVTVMATMTATDLLSTTKIDNTATDP